MKVKILKECPMVPGKPGEEHSIVSIQPHILAMFKQFEQQGYIEIINDTEMEEDPIMGLRSKK